MGTIRKMSSDFRCSFITISDAAAICFRFYALLDRLNVLEWSCTCAHSKCIRPPWPCLATHSGFKGLISAINKFPEVISRIFLSKFQQIHKASIFIHKERFISKISQTISGTSMISQFHNF